ncbi:ATP-binding protein, partial [Kibdelosporangium persicum]
MEQRKLVTVLFCDLVGSTELAGVLEPETLRSVVMSYFDTARRQIEAHGGTVEKFIGDAVMAVFGVPTVREDDARRGAAAALDMIAALAELNADLESTFDCRLSVRIGVNTGEVVATGTQGATENLVAGEVVNVAARLEQNAGPGEVLIGPVTRALLGGEAEVETVGALALKGKRDPVTTFRLLGIRPDPGWLDMAVGTPFVGRERELDLLRECWARTLDGRSQSVTLSGEAGIGKTRLVQHWLSGLPDDSAMIGSGRCHPYRDQASLTPLAQALRQILDTATHIGVPTGKLRCEPAYRVLRSGLLRDGTPGRSADSTYAAIATLLTEMATVRPVILVLDDVQWAEEVLLDGVARLADMVSETRVLLVLAGRKTGSPLRTVEVPALPEADMERLAAELVEVQAHVPAVLARVIDRAEGNPLYLEQLLAMLDDGADPGKLPVTVTAVLAARIDSLGPAERVVLDAASVVGRQFDTVEIEALAETGVSAGLPGLTRRGLVEPVRGSEYRFRSGLLRDVAYQAISKRRRADWHEALAGRCTTAAATGHHLEQAYLHRHGLGLRDDHTGRLREQAACALTVAGRSALARADLSWSADLGRRAIAHSTQDDPWWALAAEGLGETLLAMGMTRDGSELLRDVMALSITSGDQLTYAHAKLQLAALDTQPARPGRIPAADTAREVLPVFEAYTDHLGLARGHIRLAQEQQLIGSHGAAEELLAAALRHAVTADAAPEQAMALGAIGISLWYGPAPAAQAVRRCRELLALHGRNHDVVSVTLNYPLANLLALQGKDREARACLAVADKFANDLGYAEAAMFGPLFAAGVDALAGRLESAEQLLVDAVRSARAAGDPGLIATASCQLARVLLRRGKPPGPELLDQISGSPSGQDADPLGVLALAAGDPAMAHRAVAAAERTDSPITLATAHLDLAAVSLATGDAATAVTAADRAADWFAAKGHVVGGHA